MAADADLLTDEMRAEVGVASEPQLMEVDGATCRRFARAVGYTDPIYYDVDAARARGFRAIVAPPGYLGTPIYRPGEQPLTSLGYLDHPEITTELNGGNDIEYFDVLCAGDVVETRRRVISWEQVRSRMGRMLILKVDFEYSRDGKLVAIDHGTSLLVAGEGKE